MTETQLINAFVLAWARVEGFFEQKRIPSVSQRLHNPCNLPHWCESKAAFYRGQWYEVPYPEVNGLVRFPDDESGFVAARSQARINIVKRGLTFMEFFAGKPQVYRGACPRDEGHRFDPASYARQVARSIGGSTLSPYTPIISLATA